MLGRQDPSVAIYELRRFQTELDAREHADFELALIERGRGWRRLGTTVDEYAEGELCLLGSRTPHVWKADPASDPRAIVLRLPPLTVARWMLVPEWRPIVRLLEGVAGGLAVAVHGATRERVARLLREAVGAPAGSWRRPTTVLAALGALAESDERAPLETGLRRASSACARLAAVCAYLDEHLGEPVAQAEVARRVGLGPAPFSRWFRAVTGRTFGGFVAELRIARACAALVTSSDRVADIAAMVGFDSLSSFNRQFRRLVGVAPTEHRRRGHRVTDST